MTRETLETSPDGAASYTFCRRELRLPIRILAQCRVEVMDEESDRLNARSQERLWLGDTQQPPPELAVGADLHGHECLSLVENGR
jgi:hypothetical protein